MWSRACWPRPCVGVVWVGWDEETPLEVFPSLLWVRVGGGLTNRGITKAMCSLHGMGMRYLDGLNRTFYTCVDIEMDCDCNAACAVFPRFSQALKRTHKLFMVEYYTSSNTKIFHSQELCPKLPHPCRCLQVWTLCTESVSKSDVTTVTKMAPSSHPIPLTVGTFQIAKVRNDDSHRDSAHSWPLPQPTFPDDTTGGPGTPDA